MKTHPNMFPIMFVWTFLVVSLLVVLAVMAGWWVMVLGFNAAAFKVWIPLTPALMMLLWVNSWALFHIYRWTVREFWRKGRWQ